MTTPPLEEKTPALGAPDPSGAIFTRTSGSLDAVIPRPLPRGTLIGRYRLEEPIGSGGMGVVYAALDPELHRRVALKLVQSRGGAEGQARLLREAQAMAKLSHPNVLAIHDVGILEDGQVFMALELVDGQTLRQWLQREQTLERIREVFAAAAEGLAAAHDSGLVHRDFKPDNVLLGKDGRVRVMDFGLARIAGPEGEPPPSAVAVDASSVSSQSLQTQAGFVNGTPAYLAPELFQSQPADARTDQFSFGVALYEALYGLRPFSRPRLMKAAPPGAWTVDPAPRGNRVPAWLRRVCLRMLEQQPEARYPSMHDLPRALREDPLARRKTRLLRGGAVLAVVAAAVASGMAYRSAPRPCEGQAVLLAGVWDSTRAEAVRTAFLATRAPDQGETWPRVKATLDEYASAWVAERRSACEATRVRRDQPEDVLSLRTTCLDERLDSLRMVTSAFLVADARTVEKSVSAARQLPAVSECADIASLKAPVPPPSSTVRRQVEQERRKLAEAAALRTTGRSPRAAELARAVLAESRRLSYRPLEAEAGLELGRSMSSGGASSPEGLQVFFSAYLAAQAGRHDVVGARALMNMSGGAANLLRMPDALLALQLADVLVERLNNPPMLRGGYYDKQAFYLDRAGKHVEAVAAARKAIELLRSSPEGARSELLASTQLSLGMAATNAEQYDVATAAYEEAKKLYTQLYGPRDARVTVTLMDLAGNYVASGEDGRGEQILGEMAARPDPHGNEISRALLFVNLGEAQLHLGEVEAARTSYLKGLEHLAPAVSADSSMFSYFDLGLGNVELESHAPAKALVHFERALSNRRAQAGLEKTELVDPLTGVGMAQLALAKPRDAVRTFEEALASTDGKNTQRAQFGRVRLGLARALVARGDDPRRARELAAQALADLLAGHRPVEAEKARGLSAALTNPSGSSTTR